VWVLRFVAVRFVFSFMISRRDELRVFCLHMCCYGCLRRGWTALVVAMLLM